MLFPCCAALGTALAFASAGNAQELVLNSVAIGFVFELDDLLYPIVIGARARACISPFEKWRDLAQLCGVLMTNTSLLFESRGFRRW